MMSTAPTSAAFVHLHVHTEYSLLDGACRVADLISTARQLEMPALAITDHGNLFGAIEFYQAARSAGIKPIIGCELYLAPGDRRSKESKGLREGAYHLLLLAKDRTGYRNLMRLSSIGYLEGFYYKPRIDKAALREFSAGLICTSTCLGGEIPQAYARGGKADARRLAEEYLEIFGAENFLIELQNHNMPEQKDLNPELNELAQRLGIGTIATNDVHYLTHDDVEAHDVLCCISTRARVVEEDRFKFPTDQFYLKSAAEMTAALADYPDALANTRRVADLCNLDLDFSKRYTPVFRPPDEKTADDYLRELVYAGAVQRYATAGATVEKPEREKREGPPHEAVGVATLQPCNIPTLPDELRERIDYELSVIASKNFSSYFLIVWDFVRYAREHDIPAIARGSGCSTVVGYCLGISAADPMKYELYFERFMDPERDEMPDIDIDLCQDRRAEVIEYVRQKYGHVAQIITFGRLKAKAVIRDICRTLDVPLATADRVAKLVPEELKMTIAKALKAEPELQRMAREDTAIRKVLDLGQRLEGMARHASVHAAGVVIADQRLDDLVPLHKPADSTDVTTQFEGNTVEKVGLLKMDFLGLRTLSQIHLTRKLVQKNHGVSIDLDNLDLSDQRVYEMLARGETRGVFQFESGGMRDVLMKMKPNRIHDLIAANALFRPGPMEYIDDYVARKHGVKSWTTPHPLMTEVLTETYGIMVYQEQVSRLVNRLGGVPLKRAFRLAKAISKKKTEAINAERGPFLEGAAANGVRREVAEQIFEDILKFGGYAFNKAHSTGYALVAFQTAFLKTYYPAEFMAALLTYESGNTDKVAEYIDECRKLRQSDGPPGIPVLPPDVNESDEVFTVVYDGSAKLPGSKVAREDNAAHPATLQPSNSPLKNGDRLAVGARSSAENGARGVPVPIFPRRGVIRFGLAAINGLGHKAVTSILDARAKAGRFADLYDFCERVDLNLVNKGVVESLIKAGAFDSTGAMRRALMLVVEKAIELGQERQRDLRVGQMSMFGSFGGGAPSASEPANGPERRHVGAEEWTDAEMLAYEKATLGFYITKHPLTRHESLVANFGTATTADLVRMPDGAPLILGGLVSKVRTVPIKQGRNAGKRMLIATIEDFAGATEAVVFSEHMEKWQPLLKPDAIVFIDGGVDRRREEPCIRTARVIPLEQVRRELTRDVVIRVRSSGGRFAGGAELMTLLRQQRGPCRVYFEVESAAGWTARLAAQNGLTIGVSDDFLERAEHLVGKGNVLCCGSRGAVTTG